MCAYVSRDLRVVITSLPLASGHRGLCALGSMHQWPWVYAGCKAYGSALWRPVHLVVPLRTPHGASAHPPHCASAHRASAHPPWCLCAPPIVPQRTVPLRTPHCASAHRASAHPSPTVPQCTTPFFASAHHFPFFKARTASGCGKLCSSSLPLPHPPPHPACSGDVAC